MHRCWDSRPGTRLRVPLPTHECEGVVWRGSPTRWPSALSPRFPASGYWYAPESWCTLHRSRKAESRRWIRFRTWSDGLWVPQRRVKPRETCIFHTAKHLWGGEKEMLERTFLGPFLGSLRQFSEASFCFHRAKPSSQGVLVGWTSRSSWYLRCAPALRTSWLKGGTACKAPAASKRPEPGRADHRGPSTMPPCLDAILRLSRPPQSVSASPVP